MSASDQQLRIGVLITGGILVVAITYLRFCGGLSLPPKPSPPSGPTGTARQLLTRSTGSPAIYEDFLKTDAAAIGVRAPTIEEMSRRFGYHGEAAVPGAVLELGQPPIERAGLRLHVERSGDAVVLVVRNLLDSDLAYNVVTRPSIDGSLCASVAPLPFNALVIGKGSTETRTECAWRSGLTILVEKVETMEVPHLSAWYLGHVPPQLAALDERTSRGASVKEGCSPVVSAVVRSGIERGQITWRDLIDFYARHRCQTYQFASSYRAFKSDGERPLPAVD
jgi:hypothetical protein